MIERVHLLQLIKMMNFLMETHECLLLNETIGKEIFLKVNFENFRKTNFWKVNF